MIGTKLSNLGKIEALTFMADFHHGIEVQATHFWPSYFLEPQFTGVTIHSLAKKIDAGNIIHQSTPKLDPSDSLHDLSCRAVMTALNELIQILENIDLNQNFKSIVQKTSGKLFLKKDWRPEHLKIIYEYFDDNIVRHFLENKSTLTKHPEKFNLNL